MYSWHEGTRGKPTNIRCLIQGQGSGHDGRQYTSRGDVAWADRRHQSASVGPGTRYQFNDVVNQRPNHAVHHRRHKTGDVIDGPKHGVSNR